MASVSVEEEHYVRMGLLLTGISPRAVRTKFDYEFAPACLDASLKKEYNKLFDLKKGHIINQSQWNLLFPRFPGKCPVKNFKIYLFNSLNSSAYSFNFILSDAYIAVQIVQIRCYVWYQTYVLIPANQHSCNV